MDCRFNFECHPFVKTNEPYLLPHRSDKIVNLDIVENLFPECPDVINQAIKDCENLHLYPDSDDIHTFKKSILKHIGLENCTYAHIIPTNGSDSALKLIVDTFFTENSSTAIVVPNYPHFIQMARNSKTQLDLFNCQNSLDLNDLIYEFEFRSHVYITNPNLPLGYDCGDVLLQVITSCSDTLFIIDEAYFEYGKGFTCLSLLEHCANLIVVRTFSKFYGLAALRIGYLVTNEKIYNQLVVMHNEKSTTRLALNCARRAIENYSFFENNLSLVNESRKFLIQELASILSEHGIYSFNLQYGLFFLIQSKSTKQTCALFKKFCNVQIRDKSNEIADAIRISIAPLPIMKKVVQTIFLINKFPKTRFLLDLDGTIRNYAKLDCEISSVVKEFLQKFHQQISIVTNNTLHSRDKILKQLGLTKHPIDIIQPEIKSSNTFIVAKGCHMDLKKKYDAVCILNGVLDIGSNAWAHASKLIFEEHKPVFVVETSETTTINMSSEVSENQSGECLIVDVGSFLKSMNIQNYEIIGKPNLKVPDYNEENLCVIGDSNCDSDLAYNLGANFVEIDKNHKSTFSVEENKIICNSFEIFCLNMLGKYVAA